MPRFSIVVPFHQTPQTAFFLSRLLNSIAEQSFTNYEIILTSDGKMAENTNSAMRQAKGELIKILYMDDYFAHTDALKVIDEAFTKETQWLATGCLHQRTEHENYEDPHSPHLPEFTDDIHTGNNRIGSPSVVTLRNKGHIEFDESLSFLLDCDLYKRYYAVGPPVLLQDLNVVIGIGDHQTSHTMPSKEKLEEFNYLQQKYG